MEALYTIYPLLGLNPALIQMIIHVCDLLLVPFFTWIKKENCHMVA